jgi:protoheme IX farnesyltransferase
VAQGSEDLVEPLAGSPALGVAPGLAALRLRARAYHELAKPNLSALVVVTAVLGHHLATPRGVDLDLSRLAWLAVGTALTSAGACASNMVLERDLDRAMLRTRVRPIPSGRLGAEQALSFAVTAFVTGFVVLLLGTGLVPALLALFTALVYAFVYTPLKRRGPLSIWVGAVPGAVPPVMGWASVTGEIGLGGLSLFAILFTWQLPHFLALAFMYRDDYARAGFRFLPPEDLDGARTGLHIALGCALLLVVSLGPAALGLTGPIYLVGAVLAGLLFGAAGLRVARDANPRNARRAFLASIVYLPALLALLVLDRFAG